MKAQLWHFQTRHGTIVLRITVGNISIIQGGPVDYSSDLPITVDMPSGKAEYLSTDVGCMRASHPQIIIYDLKYLGICKHDEDNMNYKPTKLIIDNKAAIYMANCNKDTAGNRHVVH